MNKKIENNKTENRIFIPAMCYLYKGIIVPNMSKILVSPKGREFYNAGFSAEKNEHTVRFIDDGTYEKISNTPKIRKALELEY